MNAVQASPGSSLPAKTLTARESLREEVLGEIFGKGKGRREKPEAARESAPPKAAAAWLGKGVYVDLYV
ncbi:MAG: hypothetical protein LBW85_11550 [Deltaproteobacteria bacterium]|jgi:hypothetical protein|nr:hypothetical protein [Deltaproteobacteria bacterium]